MFRFLGGMRGEGRPERARYQRKELTMKAMIKDIEEREKTQGLNELAEMLEEAGFSLKPTEIFTQPGKKNGGVMLGLAIAGLLVSSIGTLLSLLAYYKEKHPHRRIDVSWKDTEISINDSLQKKLPNIVARFRTSSDVEEITIQIK